MNRFLIALKRVIAVLSISAVFISVGIVLLKFYIFTPAEGIKSVDFMNEINEKILSVNVEYELDGMGGRVNIEDLSENDNGINNTAGGLGHPVNITADKRKVKEAKITFTYNSDNITEEQEENLAIAYYNEKMGRMQLLENSRVNKANNTVSVTTNHFSEYVVVDSEEWYNAWAESQLVIRKMNDNNKYFDVIFTIDSSGSMDSTDKNGLSKECTYNFIRKLYSGDYFTVLQFNDSSQYVIDKQMVEDVLSWKSIRERISSIRANGGTNIEDAVLNSLKAAEDKIDDCKSLIVLLSDGQASISDDTLQKAVDANIKIITIGFGNDADEKLLQKIADFTEGQYYKADSGDLNIIFEKIRESYIGIDLSEDKDGDGIPDKIEMIGMRNQYGKVIRTDPENPDTDGDGIPDGIEMGIVVVNEDISESDKEKSLNQYVYFKMESDPTVYDRNKEYNPAIKLEAQGSLSEDKSKIMLSVKVSNAAQILENSKQSGNTINSLNNLSVNITMPECIGKSEENKLGSIASEEKQISRELIHNSEVCKGEKHIIVVKAIADNAESTVEELRIKGIYWNENLSEEDYNSSEIELIERVRAYNSRFDPSEYINLLNDENISAEEIKEYSEYIKYSKDTFTQRQAMNYICNNDIFVAHNFKEYFESAGFLKKGSFDLTKIILNDGIVASLGSYSDKERYKKMLLNYIKNNYEEEQEKTETELTVRYCSNIISGCDEIIDVLESNTVILSNENRNALREMKEAMDYVRRTDKTADGINRSVKSMEHACRTLKNNGVTINKTFKLSDSVEKDLIKNLNSNTGGIDTLGKVAMGAEISADIIDLCSSIADINACISVYEKYADMLTLIEQKSNYDDLKKAAQEIKSELTNSKQAYLNVIAQTIISIGITVTEPAISGFTEGLVGAIGGKLASAAEIAGSVSLGVTITKLVTELSVGLGDILDGAEYTVAAGEMSEIVSDKLIECGKDFNSKYNVSYEAAYEAALEYEKYYEQLRKMRIFGEQSYTDMRNFGGASGTLNKWLNDWSNYGEAENVCNANIKHLKEIGFGE